MNTVRERLAQYRASQPKTDSPPAKDKEEGKPQKELQRPLRLEEVDNRDSPGSPVYMTLLKALLWMLLWGLCVEVGVGVVYVTFSGLFLMVYSLCGSKRKSHEPSAYSVFNKDCKSIEGALTAAQFESELRYGPSSVKT